MSHGEQHSEVGHVVPLRLLFGVLVVLLLLTFVTVAVTWVDLGPLNLIVAIGIAAVKASLVLLYFMHLRWDRPFNAIVLIVSIALVALFIILSLLDSHAYQPEIIQDYAPLLDP
jgi:cytochrome c oxidase subunit 4